MIDFPPKDELGSPSPISTPNHCVWLQRNIYFPAEVLQYGTGKQNYKIYRHALCILSHPHAYSRDKRDLVGALPPSIHSGLNCDVHTFGNNETEKGGTLCQVMIQMYSKCIYVCMYSFITTFVPNGQIASERQIGIRICGSANFHGTVGILRSQTTLYYWDVTLDIEI